MAGTRRLSRRGAVDPFIVMDVMQAASAAEAAGRHVIHMEVGQPGTAAPRAARERLSADLARQPLGYTVALGLPDLRARIARHYGDWYGVDLDPNRVVVTAGASGAFVLAFTALFDAGARVGLGLPCYPSYRHILSALDLSPVTIRTRLADRFQPGPEHLAGLDGLVVAAPSNPTGTLLDRERLAALAGAASEAGAVLISDEIYHGIDYGTRALSALEVTDEAWVIGSFSKYFSMTGWRVGWMVVPDHAVRQVERLAQNLFICPPHAGQLLALHAMECDDELRANVAVYAENRARMLAALPAMGLDRVAPPDGAFYVYADVGRFTNDSRELAARILAEADVAVTPGVDFDPEEGHRWLRFSYARATADIEEGLGRLGRFFAAARAAG